jgi:hypothetical protein
MEVALIYNMGYKCSHSIEFQVVQAVPQCPFAGFRKLNSVPAERPLTPAPILEYSSLSQSSLILRPEI